ncbi:hypothetical protein B4098_1247 [Heyndrickxia coagulans]|uniref:Uncharacterized protein n=1 Tax=Heyndrickxia coagulans TaxID=1398 RepID=A0A150KCG1_HEYCO|nr:hypothetical protein B4098_1247 [Heyndrickxia coagulans]
MKKHIFYNNGTATICQLLFLKKIVKCIAYLWKKSNFSLVLHWNFDKLLKLVLL